MLDIAVKVLIPSVMAFALGIAFAPFLAGLLYRKQMWKKRSGKEAGFGGGGTPIFNELHKEREVSTPRMGGILIWSSVLATALLLWTLAQTLDTYWPTFDFVNRRETWLPLFALAAGAAAGLIDDFLEITEGKDGLSLPRRLAIVGTIGLIAGWWFYAKLGVVALGIPFGAPLVLGVLIVPFFALVTLAIYAGGTIDGIDGLAGGVFAIIFMVYAGIAVGEGQTSLAAFAATVAGATLAFLWFNIPPARFFNSETGTMALTTSLVVVAFLTKAVVPLLIIGFLLIATSASSLIQILSKKYRGGKKIFIVAPLHNHLQAMGWPPYKVTMRYWVIAMVLAVLGVIVALVG